MPAHPSYDSFGPPASPLGDDSLKEKAPKDSHDDAQSVVVANEDSADNVNDIDIDSKPGSELRWLILALTCSGLFGQFYAYDNPSTLYHPLKTHMQTGENFDFYFNLLYSVYSFPNILLPLFCGLAMDRVGLRQAIYLLSALVCLGSIIVYIGCAARSWALMLVGRTIFGIGGESLQVGQSALLYRYFKGKEIGFALGVNLAVARMGSSLNAYVSPWLTATALGGGTPLLALGMGTLLCLLSGVSNWLAVYWESELDETSTEDSAKEDFSLRSLQNLSRPFWLLVFICVTAYGAILPFNNVAQPMFATLFYSAESHQQAAVHAGSVLAILYTVSAILTPFFGYAVDKYGQRPLLLFLSMGLLSWTHATLTRWQVDPSESAGNSDASIAAGGMFDHFNGGPLVAVIQIGLVYTVLAATLWPSFALAVENYQVGTAYGVATAAQNLGMAIIPLLVGEILVENNNTTTSSSDSESSKSLSRQQELKGYEETERFFTFVSSCGFVVALVLHAETTRKNTLNLPSESEGVITGESESDQYTISSPDIARLPGSPESHIIVDMLNQKISNNKSRSAATVTDSSPTMIPGSVGAVLATAMSPLSRRNGIRSPDVKRFTGDNMGVMGSD